MSTNPSVTPSFARLLVRAADFLQDPPSNPEVRHGLSQALVQDLKQAASALDQLSVPCSQELERVFGNKGLLFS